MLPFGFLLIFTVAVEGSYYQKQNITLCTKGGEVQYVKLQEPTDLILPNACDDVKVSPLSNEILSLDDGYIAGFKHNWYQLQAPSINTVSIYHNHIQEITSEIFNDLPENIRRASVRGNIIKWLRAGMIDNINLVVLELSSNSIEEIEPWALFKLTRLSSLNLEQNKLTSTQFAAFLPSEIRSLNLTDNAITEVPANSFAGLRKLWRLSLKGNRITVIHEHAFRGLVNLECLNLSENPIQSLENGLFQHTPLLQFVKSDMRNLSDNALSFHNRKTLELGSSPNKNYW